MGLVARLHKLLIDRFLHSIVLLLILLLVKCFMIFAASTMVHFQLKYLFLYIPACWTLLV